MDDRFHTTSGADPPEMFATLKAIGIGKASVQLLDAFVERLTIRADTSRGAMAFLLEWEHFRVRIPVQFGK
jgi:hypothetical protein